MNENISVSKYHFDNKMSINSIIKSKIIEENKLILFINNKIIIKKLIICRLIKIYNDNDGFNEYMKLNILIIIISYYWFMKSEKLNKLKENLNINLYNFHKIILEKSLINNLLNLKNIYYTNNLFNKKTLLDYINNVFNKLKYIPNIFKIDTSCITNLFYI